MNKIEKMLAFRGLADFDKVNQQAVKFLCKKYFLRADSVELGRNRLVFLMKGYVIKIPITGYGCLDNDWEGSVSNTEESKNNQDYIQYPKTKLIYYKNLPILFMERVNTDIWNNKTYKDFPDWVGYVDGGQVGYTKDGRLVAFDYGLK